MSVRGAGMLTFELGNWNFRTLNFRTLRGEEGQHSKHSIAYPHLSSFIFYLSPLTYHPSPHTHTHRSDPRIGVILLFLTQSVDLHTMDDG